MSLNRSQLHKDLEARKGVFAQVFTLLKEKSEPHWYPSLWVERRASRQLSFDKRQDSVNEPLNQGVVLRVFDGHSLFEEACDQMSIEVLEQKVKSLVERVKRLSSASSQTKGYKPPSWSERLKLNLDSEITSQIPGNPAGDEWVHFGTPQKKPMWSQTSDAVKFGKNLYAKLVSVNEALPADNAAKDPDYFRVSVVLNRDDFLFIDEKVRMSQTILRNLTNAMVLKNGERGYTLMGGLGGQETVEIPDHQFLETYEYLEKTLNAEKLKPGRYKLLMGPSVTGVFAHEAFGHSQEGDTWARGRSQAKILYEQQTEIGNKHATIYNNPAIYKNGSDEFAAWGSYYFDEEGWLAQEHCLVKEGKLQQPMTNLTSSLRLNMPRTANGKRESWMRGMYVRQTNTYFSAGEKTYDDLIAQVDYGFQAVHAAGGMEDPKGMGIQVGIAYLEEIKNGQLTGKTFVGPNGGSVQMTGYVPDYLGSIVDKAKIDHFDDSFDESQHPWNEVGGCGKYHKESVMAGCGGPYMLLENVLLG